ncbi:MAG: AAA family ATPase [Bacteroidaceae bacterium]|nr:AAA family ATPase [Bacteroidaceae bacterium]
MEALKRLPVSTQEFAVIRENNLVYVDKTDLVWKLANAPEDVVFFPRPRRFGKTLLLSTLEAYFKGQKEYFDGLKIMALEKDWKQYEVLRFDLSGANTAGSLNDLLDNFLEAYETRYGIINIKESIGVRLGNVIKAASGGERKVVVLVDEYDYALQHTLFGNQKTQEEHEACRIIYRDFFAQLKSQSRYIRYIFLTGVTKFTGLSLFSVLNNIKTLGARADYQTLCGITEEELHGTLRPYVQDMASRMGQTEETVYAGLKKTYDGYHFCEKGVDVYNPFSLINALNDGEMDHYWASSGGTKMLMDAVDEIGWHAGSFENVPIDKLQLKDSDVNKTNLSLFLYQSGYLTIKDNDEDFYYLGIPNEEVARAIYQQILPRLLSKKESEVDSNIIRMRMALRKQDIRGLMENLKALVAETPYSHDNSQPALEEKFQFIVKNILFLANCRCQEEVRVANGRIDLVCEHATCILVMELNMNRGGGVEAASDQLERRDYVAAFMGQDKPVYTVAVEFEAERRCLKQYKIVQVKG